VLATWRRNAVVAVHNFADEACEVAVAIPGAEHTPLTDLLLPEHCAPDARGRHVLVLEPYGYRWFRVGPLLDVISREPS
jgi:maltose alpha-D-glucosyltransferase/alpha-amylase